MRITDLLTCSILIYFDHELEELDKKNPKKCIFVISIKKETNQILEDFHNGKIRIEPKKLFFIQKDLKSRIYN
jgi:hypothetical protein